MKNPSKFLVILLTVQIIFACSKKKNDPVPVTPGNSDCGMMTLKINNVTTTQTVFNNTITLVNLGSENGKRFDIRTTVEGKIFVLTVSNFDWQNPAVNTVLVKKYDNDPSLAACKNIDGDDYCDEMLGTLYTSNKEFMTLDETMSGHITINSMSASTKKVSGNFSFFLTDDEFDPTDTISVSGSFTNLCYSY